SIGDCKILLSLTVRLDCNLVALYSYPGWQLRKVLLDSSKFAFYRKYVAFLRYLDTGRRFNFCHYFLISRRSQLELLPILATLPHDETLFPCWSIQAKFPCYMPA